ncbi:MAG: septal ring lytic transglycosylase RlpA family protein [Spirochaetaceae bacterium]|jgi:rare lipoprotein A|nr:septal ring lytic transglycosylase RlpA family protein [Spirochaetaceae bacterium]
MKKIIVVFSFYLCAAAFAGAQNQPLPERNGFSQEGLASWYGAEFAGRPTASGELFDPELLTAAHLTLPFGTVLTVTNLNNNNQVQVKVNDRGPFVKSRIIDVSRAAAERLGIVEIGTAQVRLEMAPRGGSAAASGALEGGAVAAAIPPSGGGAAAAEGADYSPVPSPGSATAGGAGAMTLEAAAPTQIQPLRLQMSPAPAYVSPPSTGPYQPLPTRGTATTPGAPANPLLPSVQAVAAPALPAAPVAAAPVAAPVAAVAPAAAPAAAAAAPTAAIKGGPIVPGRVYRLQIGSFKVPKNAVDAFERLTNAGLNPSWETFEGYYRIVLGDIKAEDVPAVAGKLAGAGFKEAIARLEPQVN